MKFTCTTLLLLSLAAAAGCSRQAAQAPEPPAARVEGDRVTYAPNAPQLAYISVEAAQPRRLAVSHLTGRLYLADDATVRVFTPVAGQVTAIRADVGQAVAKDAPLAEISSPDYGQALADARAADASLTAADKALSRSKDLLQNGAAAAKDVEAAEAAYGAAFAERERALARLRLYHGSETGADGEAYVLRSPIAGTVIERNLNPGQEVRADQMLANATNLFAPLFVVSDPSRLWLQVDASETDLAELRPGEALRVASNAFPGRVFSGSVTNIAPELDPSTRTARVRGVVENPEGVLKAEMYVSVDVVRDESGLASAGVEIPSKAIFTIDQKSYLFVELSPGQFERRQVEIGTEKDGRVPVRSGVAAGQRIVAEGGLLLQAVLEPDN
jgi:cobalt-zinc-cadmium efflux system membrane fusion protein